MNNRTKPCALFLAFALLSAVFCGCGETPDDPTVSETESALVAEIAVEPPLDAPDAESVSYSLTIECSNQLPFSANETLTVGDELFAGDLSEFHADVAEAALLLLLENGGAKLQFENAAGETESASLYDKLHLINRRSYTMKPEDYESDRNDLAGLTIAEKLFRSQNGKAYQLFVCCIDAYIDNTGWISNVDVGADTDSYRLLNGDAPEWTDRKEHKGFSVTAARAYEKLKAHLAEHREERAETVVLVTGQSRGAAIANLLGKRLSADGLSFAVYGFNTPATTAEADESVLASYPTIFNVINGDDIVSKVPCAEWGFSRYGKDLTYRVSSDAQSWNAYFGKTYASLSDEMTASVLSLLTGLAPTREAIYEFNTDPAVLALQSDHFDTEDDLNYWTQTLLKSFPEGSAKRECIRLEISDGENGGYDGVYSIRAALASYAIADVFSAMETDDSSAQLLITLLPYLQLMGGHLQKVSPIFTAFMTDGSFTDRFVDPHVIQTNLVGITMLP